MKDMLGTSRGGEKVTKAISIKVSVTYTTIESQYSRVINVTVAHSF